MPSIFSSACAIASACWGNNSRSHPPRPATKAAPSRCARTPRPWTSSYSVTLETSRLARSAVSRMDRAKGWFEDCSASAAARSKSAPSTPSAGASLETANRPVVMVPVLSRTTVSTEAAASKVLVRLIMMPRRAAEAKAATMAVGCAIRRAPGHVTTKTVMARMAASSRMDWSSLRAVKNHTTPATINTTGT